MRTFFVLFLVLGSVSGTLRAGDFSFVGAAGAAARHQAILDLEHPVVVMSVAAEPGEEDLPSLAALRLGYGARLAAVYVTDGGATASDVNGDIPMYVAARRRCEADAAIRSIGGEAFFLGFPDYGYVSTKGNLERLWNRDSLLARLVLAIRTIRPDVILCAADSREAGGDTVRSALIREALAQAAEKAAAAQAGTGRSPGAWAASRILEETRFPGSAPAINCDAVHPVVKKSFRAIASGAASMYRSLRLAAPLWNAGRSSTYRYLDKRKGKEDNLLGVFPAIPAALREAAPDVAEAAADAGKGPEEEALRSISRAIARVENRMAPGKGSLGSLERRVLVTWKERLEDLRCAILGVDVTFSSSDTLVARRQQFSLLFGKGKKFPAKGRSEIIFPSAIDSTWFINRRDGFRFPFAVPDTVEIITPEVLELNRPVATTGSGRLTLNTIFPFVVVHRDTNPIRNFALRRETALGVSAVQTAEVLTPFVRVTPGERLVVHLQNVSRDPYRGTLSVGDSIVEKSRIPVILRRNENTRRDTLPLTWKEGVPDGEYVIDVHVGKGRPVGSFTARKFTALADTTRSVGILSGLEESPLAEALRRLHVRFRLIDGSFTGDSDAGLRTIIIDRDAFALRPDGGRLAGAVAKWVRAGGHCVMLHQDPRSTGENPMTQDLAYGLPHFIPPESAVAGDTATGLIKSPNLLSAADWSGWIVLRAVSPVAPASGANVRVDLRDSVTGDPLIASARTGEGVVTAVALDILPQLQIVHPGAYRLLANLVSY